MSKAELLLGALDKFYTNEKNNKILVDILQHKSGISLRKLEYFVTSYAKQTNLSYTTGGKLFSVHLAYKSSLDGYSKKLFDPFCRTERIQFKGITTTVAQLNFIRWCIINDIILQLGHKGQKGTNSIHSGNINTDMKNLV
jgi:hypothetical protein